MIPNKAFLILFTEAMNKVSDVDYAHTLLAYMVFKEILS